MKTYISEKRNIIEDTTANGKIYYVEFVTTTITTTLFKTTSKTESKIDDISFSSLEDAQLYVENAVKISEKNKLLALSKNDKILIRNYIFLKCNDILMQKYNMHPEYIKHIKDNKVINTYGLYGSCLFDKNTFNDFLKDVCPERKIVKTYSIYDLENIENNIEIKQLYSKRNGIIQQEIMRLKENINFLEKLIK